MVAKYIHGIVELTLKSESFMDATKAPRKVSRDAGFGPPPSDSIL
jgi:hypothetical protein